MRPPLGPAHSTAGARKQARLSVPFVAEPEGFMKTRCTGERVGQCISVNLASPVDRVMTLMWCTSYRSGPTKR